MCNTESLNRIMAHWSTHDLQALVANVQKPQNAFVVAAKDVLQSRGKPVPTSYEEYYSNPVWRTATANECTRD